MSLVPDRIAHPDREGLTHYWLTPPLDRELYSGGEPGPQHRQRAELLTYNEPLAFELRATGIRWDGAMIGWVESLYDGDVFRTRFLLPSQYARLHDLPDPTLYLQPPLW